MNFITQTHEARRKPVIVQAKMIERYHPQSTYYVYDGGLSEKSKEILSDIDLVEIIDWTDKSDYASNSGQLKSKLADIEIKIKENPYLDHIFNDLLNYKYYFNDILRWNFFIKQKPLSILDLSQKVDGDIVWMDDDAILIDKINEVYNNEFDVAVTIRSKYNEMYISESSVNSGVIIFNTTSDKIQKFVREWINLIESTKPTSNEPNVEQDMLEKLICYSGNKIVKKYYTHSNFKIDGEQISALSLPCKTYNHINLQSGIDPNENKIIHFKGNGMKYGININLLCDIEKGNIGKWNRW